VTSPTFSASSVRERAISGRLEAFVDELTKIAETQPVPVPKSEKLKRVLKSGLLFAGGAGVGAGINTIIDHMLVNKFGPKIMGMNPTTRRIVFGSLAGLATGGGLLALRKTQDEQKKIMENG
jgi:hypothetical protein